MIKTKQPHEVKRFRDGKEQKQKESRQRQVGSLSVISFFVFANHIDNFEQANKTISAT